MTTIAPRSAVAVRSTPSLPAAVAPAKPGYTRIASGAPATLTAPKSSKHQSALRLSVRFPEGRESYSGMVRVEIDGKYAGGYATFPPGQPGTERGFVAILLDSKDPARAAEIQKKLAAGTLKVKVSTNMPGVDIRFRPFD